MTHFAPISEVERQLVRELRRAIVMLLVDDLALAVPLLDGVEPAALCPTGRRVLGAARALDMLRDDHPGRWADPYASLARDPAHWRRTIDVIRHQHGYLSLVLAGEAPGAHGPAQQLRADPRAYERFLTAVSATHAGHAATLVDLAVLQHVRSLVDVGGGLGAFANAWVSSAPGRSATVVDLPGVERLSEGSWHKARSVTFHACDLRDARARRALPAGESYLLANVLHLLDEWRLVLDDVIQRSPPGAVIVVLEAMNDDGPGRLFDLQVHLRSGKTTQLVAADDLRCAMDGHDWLERGEALSSPSPDDPLERRYLALWGRKYARGS